MSVMSSSKHHQSQEPVALVLWSVGLAPTSGIMSGTVHHCPCVSDTVTRSRTCGGCHCLRVHADTPLTAFHRALVPLVRTGQGPLHRGGGGMGLVPPPPPPGKRVLVHPNPWKAGRLWLSPPSFGVLMAVPTGIAFLSCGVDVDRYTRCSILHDTHAHRRWRSWRKICVASSWTFLIICLCLIRTFRRWRTFCVSA